MWSEIGYIFVFSFFTAAFAHFVDYIIQEDEIFGFWQKVLDKLEGTPFVNPLGGCVVCMSVWICFIGFIGLFSLVGWWGFLPYIVTTNLMVRVIALWL